MSVKKIISTILCVLTISTSPIFQVSAAKSADPNNVQIVNSVNLFNCLTLEKLDYYIWRTDIESGIVRDLIDLHKRLSNFVVYDISTANELLAPYNIYDSISIGSQLEHLFSCLFIIDYNSYHNNTYENVNSIFNEAGSAFFDSSSTIPEIRAQLSETRAKLIIDSINGKLDQMELCKNKNNK